jgi:hypothetical protein
MVLLVDKPWKGTTYEKARALVTEVDCKKPHNVKERYKIVECRLRNKGVSLPEDLVQSLASRTDSSLEIEVATTTIALVASDGQKITPKDLSEIAGELEDFRDVTRSVLKGLIPRLNLEIADGEPIPTTVMFFNILHKLYAWLCSSEENEEDTLLRLKINRRLLTDWRASRHRYSPARIRELIEKLNLVYQKARRGQTQSWHEEMREIISLLSV